MSFFSSMTQLNRFFSFPYNQISGCFAFSYVTQTNSFAIKTKKQSQIIVTA